jgi:hypothetical protein
MERWRWEGLMPRRRHCPTACQLRSDLPSRRRHALAAAVLVRLEETRTWSHGLGRPSSWPPPEAIRRRQLLTSSLQPRELETASNDSTTSATSYLLSQRGTFGTAMSTACCAIWADRCSNDERRYKILDGMRQDNMDGFLTGYLEGDIPLSWP